jgi:hypothetical protein
MQSEAEALRVAASVVAKLPTALACLVAQYGSPLAPFQGRMQIRALLECLRPVLSDQSNQCWWGPAGGVILSSVIVRDETTSGPFRISDRRVREDHGRSANALVPDQTSVPTLQLIDYAAATCSSSELALERAAPPVRIDDGQEGGEVIVGHHFVWLVTEPYTGPSTVHTCAVVVGPSGRKTLQPLTAWDTRGCWQKWTTDELGGRVFAAQYDKVNRVGDLSPVCIVVLDCQTGRERLIPLPQGREHWRNANDPQQEGPSRDPAGPEPPGQEGKEIAAIHVSASEDCLYLVIFDKYDMEASTRCGGRPSSQTRPSLARDLSSQTRPSLARDLSSQTRPSLARDLCEVWCLSLKADIWIDHERAQHAKASTTLHVSWADAWALAQETCDLRQSRKRALSDARKRHCPWKRVGQIGPCGTNYAHPGGRLGVRITTNPADQDSIQIWYYAEATLRKPRLACVVRDSFTETWTKPTILDETPVESYFHRFWVQRGGILNGEHKFQVTNAHPGGLAHARFSIKHPSGDVVLCDIL